MATALETIDRRIADLRTTHERIAQNLVELDADVTRQMLDAATSLTGRTAEEWAMAAGRLSSLWQGQLALADVLVQLADTRGTRSTVPRATLSRLEDLLDGRSVSVERPGSRRSLTEGAAPTDQLTVEAVIARMSADYDVVTAVVREVAAVWTVTVPRLETLERTVAEIEAAADEIGTRRPGELASARRAIGDAEGVARCDPLSLADDVLTSVSALLDRAATSVREAGAARREMADETASVTASLEECRRSLARARAVRAELAAKVLVPASVRAELAECDAELAGLERDLAEVGRLADTSPTAARQDLSELGHRADGLRERTDRLASTGGADVATRDEFRGRLDAFRAKAQDLGLGEDLELHQLYVEARDALYTAPCDLDRARSLVVAYQRSVSGQPRGAR